MANSVDLLEDEPFECCWLDCGAIFSNIPELAHHVVQLHVRRVSQNDTSSGICLWKDCPRGRKPFSTKMKLIMHLRSHTGERPFVCPIPECQKRFGRNDILTKHIRSHANPGRRGGGAAAREDASSGGSSGRGDYYSMESYLGVLHPSSMQMDISADGIPHPTRPITLHWNMDNAANVDPSRGMQSFPTFSWAPQQQQQPQQRFGAESGVGGMEQDAPDPYSQVSTFELNQSRSSVVGGGGARKEVVNLPPFSQIEAMLSSSRESSPMVANSPSTTTTTTTTTISTFGGFALSVQPPTQFVTAPTSAPPIFSPSSSATATGVSADGNNNNNGSINYGVFQQQQHPQQQQQHPQQQLPQYLQSPSMQQQMAQFQQQQQQQQQSMHFETQPPSYKYQQQQQQQQPQQPQQPQQQQQQQFVFQPVPYAHFGASIPVESSFQHHQQHQQLQQQPTPMLAQMSSAAAASNGNNKPQVSSLSSSPSTALADPRSSSNSSRRNTTGSSLTTKKVKRIEIELTRPKSSVPTLPPSLHHHHHPGGPKRSVSSNSIFQLMSPNDNDGSPLFASFQGRPRGKSVDTSPPFNLVSPRRDTPRGRFYSPTETHGGAGAGFARSASNPKPTPERVTPSPAEQDAAEGLLGIIANATIASPRGGSAGSSGGGFDGIRRSFSSNDSISDLSSPSTPFSMMSIDPGRSKSSNSSAPSPPVVPFAPTSSFSAGRPGSGGGGGGGGGGAGNGGGSTAAATAHGTTPSPSMSSSSSNFSICDTSQISPSVDLAQSSTERVARAIPKSVSNPAISGYTNYDTDSDHEPEPMVNFVPRKLRVSVSAPDGFDTIVDQLPTFGTVKQEQRQQQQQQQQQSQQTSPFFSSPTLGQPSPPNLPGAGYGGRRRNASHVSKTPTLDTINAEDEELLEKMT